MCSFELLPDGIIVEFAGGDRYLYTEVEPGAEHLRAMIALAEQGKGLATYISQRVKGRYAAKLPGSKRKDEPPASRTSGDRGE